MKPGLWALLAASLAGSAWLAGQPDADSPVVPAVLPAGRAAAPRQALAIASASAPVRTTGAAAAATTAPRADAAPTSAGLPARPANWPAVGRAALLAWQGPPDRPGRAARPQAQVQGDASPAAAGGAPAAAPGAAFPYRWIGQLDDGGGPPQVLLSSAQRSVGVRLGQVLDGRWRIDHDPQGVLMATALPGGPALPVPGAAAGPPR